MLCAGVSPSFGISLQAFMLQTVDGHLPLPLSGFVQGLSCLLVDGRPVSRLHAVRTGRRTAAAAGKQAHMLASKYISNASSTLLI